MRKVSGIGLELAWRTGDWAGFCDCLCPEGQRPPRTRHSRTSRLETLEGGDGKIIKEGLESQLEFKDLILADSRVSMPVLHGM